MAQRYDELIPTRWSLVQRLKKSDDQESWRKFFDTYWKLIYRTATKSGLADVEAQEVVQETVIRVCKQIGQFEASPEHGSFKGWLLLHTRWCIKEQIRKRRHGKHVSPDATETSSTPTIERVADPAGLDLEKIWEQEWQSNLISAASERIQGQVKNAKHYQVFYLRAIRGVPAEKVAKLVEMTPDAVNLVKHRIFPLFEKAVKAIEINQR